MAFHIDTHDREHVGVIFFFWALSKSLRVGESHWVHMSQVNAVCRIFYFPWHRHHVEGTNCHQQLFEPLRKDRQSGVNDVAQASNVSKWTWTPTLSINSLIMLQIKGVGTTSDMAGPLFPITCWSRLMTVVVSAGNTSLTNTCKKLATLRISYIKKQCLKSQVVYSKQPKLGLTQEFVVDCAHALWVVRSIKRLVSLMLLKLFLSDSFIYFMYRMFN